MLETARSVSRGEAEVLGLAATWCSEERPRCLHICTGLVPRYHLRSMPRQNGRPLHSELGTSRDEVPGTTLSLINADSWFLGSPEASVVQRPNSIINTCG